MRSKKIVAFFSILASLLVVIGISVTVAAYIKSDTVDNTFYPAVDVQPIVRTNDNDEVYVEVAYKEDGIIDKYDVYVRVAIVVTWKNKKTGNIYLPGPVNIGDNPDYNLDLNITELDSNWVHRSADDFYYYKKVLSADSSGNNETAPLITGYSLTESANKPVGYDLDIEVIAQAVQGIGKTDDRKRTAWLDALNITDFDK